MNTYLKIGTADVSRFITENSYSVACVPVYDEESTYFNINGETVRTRLGRKITISAALCDVDDTTASALSAYAATGSASVEYAFPAITNGDFTIEKFTAALDRVREGVKFWSAEIVMCGFAADDCL
ncbi:MAG: hypothetical protein ACI4Q6_02185 [Huintestinicola sp.]